MKLKSTYFRTEKELCETFNKEEGVRIISITRGLGTIGYVVFYMSEEDKE